MSDDEWAMFGSSGSEEEEEEENYDLNASLNYNDKDESNSNWKEVKQTIEKSVDDTSLFITRQFIKSSRSIPIQHRYISLTATANNDAGIHDEDVHQAWMAIMQKKLVQRGIHVQPVSQEKSLNHGSDGSTYLKYTCDAAILFRSFALSTTAEADGEDNSILLQPSTTTSIPHSQLCNESIIRKTLVPGGFLLLTMLVQNTNSSFEDMTGLTAKDLISQWKNNDQNLQNIFLESVWDIEHAFIVHSHKLIKQSANIFIISITKRPCTINTLSCPWKGNHKTVPSRFINSSEQEPKHKTWIQYEREIAAQVTITRSIAELKSQQEQSQTKSHQNVIPIMTNENIQKAIEAFQTHGFVIIPSLFDEGTISKWSQSILSDFDSACEILQTKHQVNIKNPGMGFNEPLSYKELAMREDLRVDLRNGPCISELRRKEWTNDNKVLREIGYKCLNDNATINDQYESENRGNGEIRKTDQNNCTPSVIDYDYEASHNKSNGQANNYHNSIRFNPTIIEIVQKVLNPNSRSYNNKNDHQTSNQHQNNAGDHDLPLYKGNFGRYNFSGSGPIGTPQSLRVGQVGSVISLPNAGDQAIHADTPHLFEIHDCLPCHYANLFILGEDSNKYDNINNDTDKDSNNTTSSCFKHETLDKDENRTGENQIGGTAFIHGSHKLSVTARLTAGDDDALSTSAAAKDKARDEMHMRIIRPSIEVGDALIFDTRVLHFGLANQSKRRRPMLYVNMTHSWFNDPKNWDDRQALFE